MKRINRSMICREVASLAKRVKRGCTCDEHNVIQGKLSNTIGKTQVLVFDTEQECIDALRTLTGALLNNRLVIINMRYGTSSNLMLETNISSLSPADQQAANIVLPSELSGTTVYIITIGHFSASLFMSFYCIAPSHLSYNVNNPDYPSVMTKNYFAENYPSTRLDDVTIRFI